ncbi:cytochrome P450 [Streptomyces sp. FBKL.4005]|uniref:cytochrome P450 n=1 Tax=Streptomyces sp. FBKL.4005 TaxID=2015515 RepID=UPI000B95E351|nr:cytochrome P450 [Streptomyces sp. FBKL.4005]OYP13272.1 cytochrome P450 [Streptomyces sp. FBKL.4005]
MVSRTTAAALAAGGALLLSSPAWLPARVVALRTKVFARVNGDEAMFLPNAAFGPDRFREVYGHPAAGGRSKGAALSDLFWYWLAPGADVHQEHLEAGPRYEEVARRTAAVLSRPSAQLYAAAARHTRQALDATATGRVRSVRLRDLMMPVWAGFFYELVFEEPCPAEARRLIVANAEDVVNALKCTRLRHMRRRHRLTRYLLRRLAAGDLPHVLPAGLTRRQQALYLQGTFFNTAVVQMSEAMAHLLLALAQHPRTQQRVAATPDDDRYLTHVMNETFRLYPLFGVAHRITTADISLDGLPTIPAGTVLTFSYPDYHATGYADPERFDPERWAALSAKNAHHIPFGVATNRPCPAWRLAPVVMRAATREVLARYELDSPVSHTRSIPHRAPCLLVPRDRPLPLPVRRVLRTALTARDRAEDVGRSLLQLLLGTWMVLAARRTRPAATYFAHHDTEGRPLRPDDSPHPDTRPEQATTTCPYPGRS